MKDYSLTDLRADKWRLFTHIFLSSYRIRIKTEEKTKVAAAGWGTELVKFLALE